MAFLSALALSTGCTLPATAVLVRIDTDSPARVVSMRAEVSRGGTPVVAPQTQTWIRSAHPDAFVFPASFGITPGGGPLDGSVTLRFEMSFAQPDATVVTAHRIARFRFLPRQPSEIRIFIPATCSAIVQPPSHCSDPTVTCTISEYCAEQPGQTCGEDGHCVSADTTLAPLNPDGGETGDVPPLPVNSATPTITTGARYPGDSVSVASFGTWTNAPTAFAVQWLACDASGNACTTVLGASDSAYTFSAEDLGSTFRAAVTATNDLGPSALAMSAPTVRVRDHLALVQDRAFTSLPNPGQTTSALALASPTIGGDLLVASVETAIAALDMTFSCNVPCAGWQPAIANPSGGNSFEGWLFYLANAPAGVTTLTASSGATPTRWAWNVSEWRGASIATPIDVAPVGTDTSGPTVMSSAITTTFEDDLLIAGLGNQSWQAAATAERPFVALETSRGTDVCADQCSITRHSSYRIVDTIGVYESTWSSVSIGGTVEIAAFRARTEPNDGVPIASEVPTLAGTPRVGATMSTTTGVWSESPMFVYQWLRCDAAGLHCGAALGAGATNRTYQIDATDAGGTLRARVTASNASGTSRQLLSAASGLVSP